MNITSLEVLKKLRYMFDIDITVMTKGYFVEVQ